MNGFSTKGQHISDLGFRLMSRNAPPPEDMEVRESIFGVQGDYDFSMILGEPIKENRLITYVVRARETERARFRLLKTKLENWLLDGRISPIYDDYEIGYHYLGKCIGVDLESDDSRGIAMYTITFDCYPFKISKLPEGHDIWEEFNFELDVAQEVQHTVNGTKEITLYNVGAPSVVPTIIASSEMTIEKGAVSVTVPPGTSKSELLRLNAGENKLKVIGNGTIKFDFHKELI